MAWLYDFTKATLDSVRAVHLDSRQNTLYACTTKHNVHRCRELKTIPIVFILRNAARSSVHIGLMNMQCIMELNVIIKT